MSRCLYSNVSKVPYHMLLLVHVSEAAKMAALSHTSCLQEVPTILQLGAILNTQVAFVKVQVTLQQVESNTAMITCSLYLNNHKNRLIDNLIPEMKSLNNDWYKCTNSLIVFYERICAFVPVII